MTCTLGRGGCLNRFEHGAATADAADYIAATTPSLQLRAIMKFSSSANKPVAAAPQTEKEGEDDAEQESGNTDANA